MNETPAPVATPPPPYIAVLFVGRLRDIDLAEYRARNEALFARVREFDGFLGEDALSSDDNQVISLTYWRDEESLDRWKFDAEHMATKRLARESYFSCYELRIARVEAATSFRAEPTASPTT